MSDPYIDIENDDEHVIEPETWTRIPKFDLWLEGRLGLSQLSSQDRRRAVWLLAKTDEEGNSE